MNSCRLHFILRNNSIMKHSTPFILLALLTAFSAQAKHPNILFIIADDQSPFDFKAYNPSSPLDSSTNRRYFLRGTGALIALPHP